MLPGAPVDKDAFFQATAKEIRQRLVERRPLELQRNRQLKLVSRPGESPDDFAARCDAAAQDRADAETAKIRDRLEAKRDRLDRALGQAQRRVEELQTRVRDLEKRLKSSAANGGRPRPAGLAAAAREVAGIPFVGLAAPFASMDELKAYAKDVHGSLGSGIITLVMDDEAPQVWVTVSDDLVARGLMLDGRFGADDAAAYRARARSQGLQPGFAALP